MISEVKIEGIRCKSRFVANEHMTKTPNFQTYSSIFSHETVHPALIITALNNFQGKAVVVMNAYVNVPITEKLWTVFGN